MELVHDLTYQASFNLVQEVGQGPYGTRLIVSVSGGWAKGDRISGSFEGAAADWLLICPDGWARLDVRGQLVTDDGAIIYLTYQGVLEFNETVQRAFAEGGETSFDDQYFRTTPRLETGDERYAWVNGTMFVGKGRLIPQGVEYELYRVT